MSSTIDDVTNTAVIASDRSDRSDEIWSEIISEIMWIRHRVTGVMYTIRFH